MSVKIVVNLQVEGIHCWKNCPLIEVGFLRSPHRHMFHIKCIKEVSHNDRDIEIILFKRKVLDYLYNRYQTRGNCLELGSMSCEMLAEDLVKQFKLCECEVLEDGENGALITN